MTAVIAAITVTLGLTQTWESPTPDPHVDGLSTFYADGVFARVAANRGLVRYPGEFPGWLAEHGYVCAVAMNRKGDLGRSVWLQYGDRVLGPCFSVDCSALHHYQRRLDQNRVVEVDWATARSWGMLGPVPIRVLFNPPIQPAMRYLPQ